MDVLPVPTGAVIREAGCTGTAGAKGFLCLVKARAGVPMEEGAAAAGRRMSGWTEYSWDWVPGRIQSSWTRGDEIVSIAVHEDAAGSIWSLTYSMGPFDDPLPRGLMQNIPPDPAAKVPEQLASLPVPKDARLLRASSQPGLPHADAVFAVEGDPKSILADYESMPGWTRSMNARAPWAVTTAWRREKVEVVISVHIAKDGKHQLVLRSQPAF